MPLDEVSLQKTHLLGDEEEKGEHSWQNWLRTPRNDEQRTVRLYCLLALNVVFFISSLGLYMRAVWFQASSPGSLTPCIHSTDMEDARSAIEYEQRAYTGSLVYDPNTGKAGRRLDAEIEYFGPPTDELDKAWHSLLHGELAIMKQEEAQAYLPELLRLPTTHEYHFEPDMFHTLHCLNAVRLEVSKTLYNVSSPNHHQHKGVPEDWDVQHMEHCLDRLRQSVMCHGDLTPSPIYYWPGFPIALGRTGPRTCRKWEPIRKWMDERGKAGKALDAF